MEYRETPLSFDCEGATLVGIVAAPQRAARLGVVIVVGGPQYRVGSHRQFVSLARALATGGVACLRFDYRGMGDSDGEPITFDAAGADISAALDAFRRRLPELEAIVLWGLCDGATACGFTGSDPRVSGIVAVNPWVRTEDTVARARVRHYYTARLTEPGFRRKLWRGDVDLKASAAELACALRHLMRMRTRGPEGAALPDRLATGLREHRGPVLVILSGRDQTADEFRVAATRNGALRGVLRRTGITRVEIPDADHTMSTASWRDATARITLDWLRANFAHAFYAAT